MSLKLSIACTLFLLQFACLTSANAQQQGPRFFHYNEIAGHTKELRKGALEYIVIDGDNTPEGDQRIIDTLQMLLGEKIPSGSSGLWRKYPGVIQNIQIRRAAWRVLPTELGRFRRLFELNFIACPHLTLQGINDQIKMIRDQNKDDNLYKKFKNDIVSISFYDTNFEMQDSCHLEVKMMEELRELRFVRIGNFKQQCENLLTELNRAYPSLNWLTIESCGLDNTQSLLPLEAFKNLKSLSLSRNFLSRMPRVSASVHALDVSYNFISEFPDKSEQSSLKKLDFLYVECNLFDYINLYKILSDTLLNKMEVLSYDPCNFDNPDELKLISHAFDKRQVAVYMPFVERYQNDFAPAPPDCIRCQPHRDQFLSALLKEVTFIDSSGARSHISFEPGNSRMQMRSVSPTTYAPSDRIYMYRRLKSCIRNFTDPDDSAQVWDWQLCFWLEDANSFQGHLQKLVLNIKDNTGVMKWGEVDR